MTDRERTVLRREYLALASTGVALTAGCAGAGDDSAGPSEPSESSESDQTATDTQTSGAETKVTAEGSLQAAIDDAAAGERVKLGSGTYEESVTVEKAIELTAPEGATLDGSTLDSGTGITVAADDVTVRDVEIVGYSEAGIATDSAVSGLTLDGVSFSTNGTAVSGAVASAELTGVSASESASTAVDVQPTERATVTLADLTVEQAGGHGVRVAGGQSVTIENPDVRLSSDDGIRVTAGETRGQTVTVTGGATLENGSNGLTVAGTEGVDEITVSDLDASDNEQSGIDVDGDALSLTDVTATDNGPAEAGVMVRGSNEGDVTVTGATVERTGRDVGFAGGPEGRGLSITDGKAVTVENATLTDNGGWNLRLETDAVRGQTVEVTGSSAVGNEAGASVSITGSEGTDEVTVTGTTVEDATENGMRIDGDTVTVTDCEARDNGPAKAGIEILGSTEGDVTVTGTTVERTGRDVGFAGGPEGRGLSITDGKTVTVENTTLVGNGGWNLRIDAEDVRGRTVEVVGVEADGNEAGSGISIPGTEGTDGVAVRDTTSTNHTLYGYSLGGESVTLENASASGNAEGSLELLDISRSEAQITGGSL